MCFFYWSILQLNYFTTPYFVEQNQAPMAPPPMQPPPAYHQQQNGSIEGSGNKLHKLHSDQVVRTLQ